MPLYEWHGWDNESYPPPSDGEYWLTITEDGEEIAVIVCRQYERVKLEHPEWITQKETAAQHIVDALNFYEEHSEYVGRRGTEQ